MCFEYIKSKSTRVPLGLGSAIDLAVFILFHGSQHKVWWEENSLIFVCRVPSSNQHCNQCEAVSIVHQAFQSKSKTGCLSWPIKFQNGVKTIFFK